MRTLDPSYQDITPWELRVYHRKRSHDRHVSKERTQGDRKRDNVEGAISGVGSQREKCHMITIHDQRDSHMSPIDKQRTVHDDQQKCDGHLVSLDSHTTQLGCCQATKCEISRTRLATNNPLHLEYLSSGSSD